jgi:hypothetical protein
MIGLSAEYVLAFLGWGQSRRADEGDQSEKDILCQEEVHTLQDWRRRDKETSCNSLSLFCQCWEAVKRFKLVGGISQAAGRTFLVRDVTIKGPLDVVFKLPSCEQPI